MHTSLVMTVLVLCFTCIYARRGSFEERNLLRNARMSDKNICRLRPKTGPCKGSIQRWYYSGAERRCKQFVYGGCDGNNNNFVSIGECKHYCMTVRPSHCNLEPQYGPCPGRGVRRWFYNRRSRTCEIFLSSGCQENGNYFLSRDSCEDECA